MLDLKAILKVTGSLKKALQKYLHVKDVAKGTPAGFTSETTKREYMAYVQGAAIQHLSTAWARPDYLEYLEELPAVAWRAHLRDVLRIRDAHGGRNEVPVQGATAVRTPEGDLRLPDSTPEVRGVQPAGDGED